LTLLVILAIPGRILADSTDAVATEESDQETGSKITMGLVKIVGGGLLLFGGVIVKAFADVPSCNDEQPVIGPCNRGEDSGGSETSGIILMGSGGALMVWGLIDIAAAGHGSSGH
jgi:hypothetical protein